MSTISSTETANIISKFKNNFKEDINIKNVTEAVITLMKIVGKLSKLNGHEKKSVVTEVLVLIINEINLGEFDEVMDTVVSTLVPVIIDNLISVQNGKIVFNEKTKKKCSCLWGKF